MAINFLSTEAIQGLDKQKRNEYLTWLSNAAGGAPSGHWQSLINLADKGEWGEINYQLPSMQRSLTDPYGKAQEYGQRVKEYTQNGQTGGAVTNWGNEAKAAYDSFAGRYDSAPAWFKTPQQSYDELIGKLPAVNPYSAQGVVGLQEQAMRPPAPAGTSTVAPMTSPGPVAQQQSIQPTQDQTIRPPVPPQTQPTTQQAMATLVNAKGERVAVPVGSQMAQQYFGQGFRLEGVGEAPNRPVTMVSPTGQRVVAETTQKANELMASGFRPEVSPAGQVQQPLRPPTTSIPSPDYRSEAISNPIGSGTIPFMPSPVINPILPPTPPAPPLTYTQGSTPTRTLPTPPTPPTQNLSRTAFDEWMKLQQQTQEDPSQPELDAIIAQQANLASSRDLGVADLRNQAIAMPFITGQTAALERSAAAKMGALESQSVPLKLKIAKDQAKRAAASDVAKAKYEFETEQEKLAQERSKGVEVGGALVDPTTGRVIYKDQSTKDPKTLESGGYIWEKQNDGSWKPVGGSGLASQQRGLNNMTPAETQNFLSISNKLQSDSIVKGGVEADSVIQIADQVISDPTKSTNQMKALYSFISALDPGTAVKEGEQQLALKAQSYISRFGQFFEKIANNQTLPKDTAVEMANATKDLAAVWKDAAKRQQAKYAAQARIVGLEPQWNEYISLSGNVSGIGSQMGTSPNIARTTLQAVENSIGQSLNPEVRAKVQEALNTFPEATIEDILTTLGFKTELQTSFKGNTDVSKIKDFSKVSTSMGSGIATGIVNGSSVWPYGMDLVLDGGKGAPVPTPFSGTVIATETKGGFGNSVKIKLDNGEVLRLSHLDSMNVKPGQKVSSGSVIGTQGNTGKTIGETGIHVDVTMYKPDGKPYSSKEVASFINTKLKG